MRSGYFLMLRGFSYCRGVYMSSSRGWDVSISNSHLWNQYWNSSGSELLIYSSSWTPNASPSPRAYKIHMIQKASDGKVVPVPPGRNQKPRHYELLGLSVLCTGGELGYFLLLHFKVIAKPRFLGEEVFPSISSAWNNHILSFGPRTSNRQRVSSSCSCTLAL